MRKLLIGVFVIAGCGGGSNLSTVESTPRPQPQEGGFQAQSPPVEPWQNLGIPEYVSPLQRTLQLSGHGGPIGQLLIKGVSGEPEVQQVVIEYIDKSQKKVDLKRRFVPGDGQVIELREERPIEKIILITDPDSAGQIEIFGA